MAGLRNADESRPHRKRKPSLSALNQRHDGINTCSSSCLDGSLLGFLASASVALCSYRILLRIHRPERPSTRLHHHPRRSCRAFSYHGLGSKSLKRAEAMNLKLIKLTSSAMVFDLMPCSLAIPNHILTKMLYAAWVCRSMVRLGHPCRIPSLSQLFYFLPAAATLHR